MRFAVTLALAAPGLALVVAFLALPLMAVPVMALLSWDGVGTAQLDFGLRALHATAVSTAFWAAAGRTALYACMGTALVVGIAMPLAFATATSSDRLVRRLAIATLVPMALSGVASALLQQRALFWAWRIIERHFGMNPVDPLGSPLTAFAFILAIDLWQSVGMCWLLLDGIVQRLMTPYFDVSRMAGLAGWRLHLKLTLPLAANAVVAVWILEFLHRLAAFDAIFVVTGGGPFFGTEVMSLFVLRSVWGGQTDGAVDYGMGAAASTLFMIASMLVIATAWPRVRAVLRVG